MKILRISVAFLLSSILILSGCANPKPVEQQQVQSNQVVPAVTPESLPSQNSDPPRPPENTANSSLTGSDTPKNEAQPEDEQKLNQMIADGTIQEAKEDKVYAPRKVIVISKSMIVAVEGYRIDADQLSISQGKYYVIVDFSIMNGKREAYSSSLSSFSLTDELSYSYSPTIAANVRGDINGEILKDDMKRGEIAFEVPKNAKQFQLQFKTDTGNPNFVRFGIDVTSLFNQPSK